MITAAAVIWRQSYPYFFVGWFWYVGMLVPVLGLTYRGCRGPCRPLYVSSANRALHCPGLGRDAAGCLVAGAALGVWHRLGVGVGGPDGLHLAAGRLLAGLQNSLGTRLGMRSKKRPGTLRPRSGLERNRRARLPWRNTGRPWKSDPNEQNIYQRGSSKAHNALGDIAARKGDMPDAIAHYKQALELDPNLRVSPHEPRKSPGHAREIR